LLALHAMPAAIVAGVRIESVLRRRQESVATESMDYNAVAA
jgi:hypothetical protein